VVALAAGFGGRGCCGARCLLPGGRIAFRARGDGLRRAFLFFAGRLRSLSFLFLFSAGRGLRLRLRRGLGDGLRCPLAALFLFVAALTLIARLRLRLGCLSL
jgi:hypothetical protein